MASVYKEHYGTEIRISFTRLPITVMKIWELTAEPHCSPTLTGMGSLIPAGLHNQVLKFMYTADTFKFVKAEQIPSYILHYILVLVFMKEMGVVHVPHAREMTGTALASTLFPLSPTSPLTFTLHTVALA
ncbi:hypothetical protein EVAR_99948_1 [Eumeta japonica]|uniref:Uncharacterized protein n=1 Tax=Eumeta variegata TaxID=151549 RepID=A0A4C1ZKM1_EUMVA|nr:hypothetical protein EVAR_99948_1 [Eumeta japonica]